MKRAAGISCAAATLLALSAPASAQSNAAPSSLQAGGLAPPEAVATDAPPTPALQTEVALERADREDSGRGLEFVWLNAEAGPEYLGLHTLKSDGLVDGTVIDSKGAGMTYGAGLGVRLLAFTLGARFRFGNFSDFQLWTLGAEAGLHIPLGSVEPYFTLGAGYASLGGLNRDAVGTPVNDAHGLDVRASAGLDVYLTNTFSVGGNLSGDLLFLGRSGADGELPQSANGEELAAGAVYRRDGSGIGAGATLSVVLGLHF